MPFITEELWGQARGRKLLVLGPWPTADFEDAEAAAEINWLVDLISAIRSVRSEMNVPAAAMVRLSVAGAYDLTKARLAKHDAVIRRLARIEAVEFSEEPLRGAVQIHAGEATLSLPLAGVIDLSAERARLEKELDRVAKEIAKIDAKLSNAQFLAKAPEDVVEEQMERRAEAAALREKTEAGLKRLAG
jgi:valyl-tRNA synthetase